MGAQQLEPQRAGDENKTQVLPGLRPARMYQISRAATVPFWTYTQVRPLTPSRAGTSMPPVCANSTCATYESWLIFIKELTLFLLQLLLQASHTLIVQQIQGLKRLKTQPQHPMNVPEPILSRFPQTCSFSYNDVPQEQKERHPETKTSANNCCSALRLCLGCCSPHSMAGVANLLAAHPWEPSTCVHIPPNQDRCRTEVEAAEEHCHSVCVVAKQCSVYGPTSRCERSRQFSMHALTGMSSGP